MTDKNKAIPEAAVPEDEINLLEAAYALVKYKLVIVLLTAIGGGAGYWAAKEKGPVYEASAVIMAKEADRPLPNLGALGALGSLAAGQLNTSANPGLEKIEAHFDSRQFQAEFIEKYGLLNDIYKYGAPRLYKRHFDAAAERWSENGVFPPPTPRDAAEFFGRRFVRKENDPRRGTATFTVKSPDSLFTIRAIEGSLEHLNRYIRANVQKDAKDNVDFLEQQLITIADPLLREKLQGMIATEVEKAMIVSKEAFKVIDAPFCVRKHREKIVYPAAGAIGLFMTASIAVIIMYYLFGGGNTGSESRKWLALIRRRLFKFF